jgi:hypothetical protein
VTGFHGCHGGCVGTGYFLQFRDDVLLLYKTGLPLSHISLFGDLLGFDFSA